MAILNIILFIDLERKESGKYYICINKVALLKHYKSRSGKREGNPKMESRLVRYIKESRW